MSRPIFGRKMKFEVKPCPLCGYNVKIREFISSLSDDGKKKYIIRCGKCDCGLPPARNLPKLIKRWDKRTKA